MKKLEFKNACFIKTATKPQDYPILRDAHGDLIPEIAVAGRSNVGKSSLLNHLFQRKGLVKTSSTPGKTQALNFFTVDDGLAFVDLPGYGYAQVSEKIKKQWGPMVQTYLEKRDTLKLILFLFDIRRLPNEDDLRLLEWIVHYQKAAILVLTKLDKVSKQEGITNTKKILQTFATDHLHHVHYSVPKNKGRRELAIMIADALTSEIYPRE